MWNLCVTSKILTRHADGTPVPFAETAGLIREAGFEEVDMSLEAPLLTADDAREQLEERLRICEKTGIRIRYCHLPYHYPAENDAEGWEVFHAATRSAIDFAKRAGADCAAVHPRSFMTRDYDPEREYSRAYRFLEPVQDYAVKRGFPLALENMRGAGRSADPAIRRFGTETADVIALADALNMGICWDTGHGNISGQDQYESLVRIGSRLRMVHLNDNFAEDDVHLALFLGRVSWDGVAKGLREIGYQGSLNTEVECNGRPEPLRVLYARYMAEAVRTLREMMTEAQ